MEYVDHDFYVFRDPAGAISVVYKRNGGGVGLIGPQHSRGSTPAASVKTVCTRLRRQRQSTVPAQFRTTTSTGNSRRATIHAQLIRPYQ